MWMTVEQASKELGISISGIRRQIAKGKWEKKIVYTDNGNGQNGKTHKVLIRKEVSCDTSSCDTLSCDTLSCDTLSCDTLSDDTFSGDIPVMESSRDRIDPVFTTGDIPVSDISSSDSQQNADGTGLSLVVGGELATAVARNCPTIGELSVEFYSFSEDVRRLAIAKMRVVMAYREFKTECRVMRISMGEADSIFLEKIRALGICTQELILLDGKGLSIKNIRRWDQKLRDTGQLEHPLCLCDSRNIKSGRNREYDERSFLEIRAIYTKYKRNNATTLYEIYKNIKTAHRQDISVSFSQFSRIIHNLKNDPMINSDKKSYKDTIRPHVVRINNSNPGDIWESDGHKCNFLVYSPFPFLKSGLNIVCRPELILWVDRGTGYILSCIPTIGEDANVIRTSLYYAIKNSNSMPRKLRMDNGSGYKNVDHCPDWYLKQKGNRESKKRAEQKYRKGDFGLYHNLKIDYTFTTPNNPESKAIEPFWSYWFSEIEKMFPTFTGINVADRPEEMMLSDRKLVEKHGDMIPTWDEFCEVVRMAVERWNHRPRPCLKNTFEVELSPYDAYYQWTHTRFTDAELNEIIRLPYPDAVTVSQSRIMVKGNVYEHPLFGMLNGRRIKYYFDETNINQVLICDNTGKMVSHPATMIDYGYQVGDDMTGLINARTREKKMKLAYIQCIACQGNMIAMSDAIARLDFESMLLLTSSVQDGPKRGKPIPMKKYITSSTPASPFALFDGSRAEEVAGEVVSMYDVEISDADWDRVREADAEAVAEALLLDAAEDARIEEMWKNANRSDNDESDDSDDYKMKSTEPETPPDEDDEEDYRAVAQGFWGK